MVKVWFPNMFMRLISWKPNRTPPQALFNISPRMTKTEVKEYCNKIYGVPVVKVMTANYLGSLNLILIIFNLQLSLHIFL
jgi:hypothetical protein